MYCITITEKPLAELSTIQLLVLFCLGPLFSLSCLWVGFFHRYVDIIEEAIVAGDPVLIENLDETIDPMLDPLLGRCMLKKGR